MVAKPENCSICVIFVLDTEFLVPQSPFYFSLSSLKGPSSLYSFCRLHPLSKIASSEKSDIAFHSDNDGRWLFFFFFFRGAGSSYARGRQSFTCQAAPQPQQGQDWAKSATYTIAHGNTTHWVRPGIKPELSWILVGFITTSNETQQEFPGDALNTLSRRVYFGNLKLKDKNLWWKFSDISRPGVLVERKCNPV